MAAVDALPETVSGPFTTHRCHGPEDFRDGLSQTIGVSERLQGDWFSNVVKHGGDYWLAPFQESRVSTAEQARLVCAARPESAGFESRGGESWFLSGLHFTCYNHCATPNPKTDDCALDDSREDLHSRVMHSGVFSATSYHPGAVHVGMMDGSVRSMRDAVNLAVWRALATRAGGEAVDDDRF
jgi:hypothetical protein